MSVSGEMKIAISGLAGCGSTTLSKALANLLGYERINFTFKDLAKKYGITVEDIEKSPKVDDYDKEVDETQIRLAKATEDCIIASRLAIWLIDADIKVYLDTPAEVRYKRIADREGISLEEARKFNSWRDTQDHDRYKKTYGIDNYDKSAANVVLDGTKTPDELVEDVISLF
jgi:cytidylate kinase